MIHEANCSAGERVSAGSHRRFNSVCGAALEDSILDGTARGKSEFGKKNQKPNFCQKKMRRRRVTKKQELGQWMSKMKRPENLVSR